MGGRHKFVAFGFAASAIHSLCCARPGLGVGCPRRSPQGYWLWFHLFPMDRVTRHRGFRLQGSLHSSCRDGYITTFRRACPWGRGGTTRRVDKGITHPGVRNGGNVCCRRCCRRPCRCWRCRLRAFLLHQEETDLLLAWFCVGGCGVHATSRPELVSSWCSSPVCSFSSWRPCCSPKSCAVVPRALGAVSCKMPNLFADTAILACCRIVAFTELPWCLLRRFAVLGKVARAATVKTTPPCADFVFGSP